MPKKPKKNEVADVENPDWVEVTLELSDDVMAAVRGTGPGWQVRVDEALREKFVR